VAGNIWQEGLADIAIARRVHVNATHFDPLFLELSFTL
jgi:hypothetical protein